MSDYDAGQDIIHTMQIRRGQCVCGEVHPDGDGVTATTIARMRAYLVANPGHEFAVDEDAGIIAVIIPRPPDEPQVLHCSGDLAELLNRIGVPPAEILS